MKKSLPVLTLLGALGLSSCSPNKYNGVYEGHKFKFIDWVNSKSLSYNSNTLDLYSNKNENGFIRFTDYDGDMIFDSLSLVNVKNDDPLRNFTCLKTGQKIIEPFIHRK